MNPNHRPNNQNRSKTGCQLHSMRQVLIFGPVGACSLLIAGLLMTGSSPALHGLVSARVLGSPLDTRIPTTRFDLRY